MHYLFQINNSNAFFKAKAKLIALGFKDIYSIEEETRTLIGAFHPQTLSIDFLDVIKMEPNPEIDWHTEWKLHANYYSEGQVIYPLNEKINMYLQPGAGFGDLSHPTTLLILEELPFLVKNRWVIDIGTGSGVLAIASSLLKAKQILAVDIDKEALIHAKNNTKLNHVHNIILTDNLQTNLTKWENPLILMNMTLGDQKNLFNAYPKLLNCHAEWLISGLLIDQLSDYSYFNTSINLRKTKENWALLHCKN